MPRGLFITLEGPEGGGKTTQAGLLVQALLNVGRDAGVYAEPGGGPIGRSIREILLSPASSGLTTRAELLLFLAARAQHVEETIRPDLDKGRIVICDRFSDSTLAYQGYAGGLDLDTVRALDAFATRGLVPDLTFVLDIDARTGLLRQSDWNRMEAKGLEYHERVRSGFIELARRHSDRIHVLDATLPVPEVHQEILRIVTVRLDPLGM
jgi:dTMP kinase